MKAERFDTLGENGVGLMFHRGPLGDQLLSREFRGRRFHRFLHVRTKDPVHNLIAKVRVDLDHAGWIDLKVHRHSGMHILEVG